MIENKTNTIPKLVASDIGGTLIRGSGIMPDFSASVLNKLVEMDVPVALITGYNYTTTKKFTRNLDERVMRLPQNGTLCIREGDLVWEYRIPENEARQLHEYLDGNDWPTIVYKGRNENFRNLYVCNEEIPALSYAFKKVDRLSNGFNGFGGFENITGISTLLPDGKAIAARRVIEAIVGGKFKVIYTREAKGSWLEVVHTDVRKDLALMRLCSELDIELEQTVYFGDNFNDLEVLRKVGRPVLVANAAPEMKREFGTIIGSVHEEGVAHYLSHLFNLGL